jgi:hypothetical protein
MKKTKTKERFENAVNAFFENEEQFENTQLAYMDNSALLPSEAEKSFTESIDSTINLLKQIFFFIPGAFLLYFMTLLIAFFPMPSSSFQILLGLLPYLTAAIFMTFAGVGSLKEIKNLIVPFTIISFAAIFATLVSLLPLTEEVKGNICFYYSAYLFPVALIIANLAKTWVKNEGNED